MAKLGVDDADTMHRIAARASEVADQMNRFEVVNTLWALQKLRIRHWSPAPLVQHFIGMVDEADA